MDKRLLDLSAHIRHSSKAMKQVNRNEKRPSRSHQHHLNLLSRAWNKLPDSEKSTYGRFLQKEIQSVSASPAKENPQWMSSTKLFEEHNSSGGLTEILHREGNDLVLCSLFIGDFQAANDLTLLKKNGIYAILSLGAPPEHYTSIKGGYLALELPESNEFEKAARSVHRFINNKIKRGNVLVHAYDGKGPAWAAAIAYFMIRCEVCYESARVIVEREEREFCLSRGFERELRRLERNWCDESDD